MGGVTIHVQSKSGSPVSGAQVTLWGYSYGIPYIVRQGTTGADGNVWMEIGFLCVGANQYYAEAKLGAVSAKTPDFWTDTGCNAPEQVVTLVTLPAPQFEITALWVKYMKQGSLVKSWNMLEVGSPEPGHTHTWPKIPEWTSDQGSYNLQIEATVRNLTNVSLTVKFRTQTCPRNTGGLPPMPIPPCGSLLDSAASVTIAPGETKLLPIWQLQMWSENIDEHNEIVDVNGTVYNCLVDYWDNATYRADDWYTPVDTAGVGPVGPKGKIINLSAPSSAAAGSTVKVSVTYQNVGDTSADFPVWIEDRDTGDVVSSQKSVVIAPGDTIAVDFSLSMPNRNWNLRAAISHS